MTEYYQKALSLLQELYNHRAFLKACNIHWERDTLFVDQIQWAPGYNPLKVPCSRPTQ